MSEYTTDTTSDSSSDVLGNTGGYSSGNGIVGSMANTASQFGDTASQVYGLANQYAQSQGGWGNAIEHAASGYVKNHGGVAGTAAHLGHEALNTAANTLWGAKDWGDAYRKAESGNWLGAAGSALWGLASLGATASMVIPGVGEAVKGAELAAQAGRTVAKEGVELAAKDVAETGAKEVAETGAKDVAETGAKDVAEEGSTTVEKAAKAEKWGHRLHELGDINLDFNLQAPQGQQETYTRAY